MELFYTEHDKNFFAVLGYTNGTEKVSDLIIKAEEFAKIAGCKLEQVNHMEVTHSQRYKYMRVLWVNKEFTQKNIPEGTFFIKEVTEENRSMKQYSVEALQWNMLKWLTN